MIVPKGPIDNNPALPNRQQAIIWTNADPIHWCIYAAPGGDELTYSNYQKLDSLLKIKQQQNNKISKALHYWLLYSETTSDW